MKEVIPGVYVETRYKSGNVGLILTGQGAVCVDVPMMPGDAEHWRTQICKVTGEPVLYIIQTDYDRERVISTCLFDAQIVAHEATWDKMKMYRNEKKVQQIKEMLHGTPIVENWEARLPDITFTERLIISKGSREIHIMYGGGHSSATSMIYLPEDRLIFTGDLVYNHVHPSMSQAQTKEWLDALNQLRKLVVDTIVPGHGDICDKESTYPLSDYIREMRARVRRCFQANRSKSETSSVIIAEFMDAFPYHENERDRIRRRIKNSSDRIYDEYRAEARTGTSGDARGSPRQDQDDDAADSDSL